MLGFERHEAARLAMLMSIPITLATGAFLALKVARAPAPAGLLWQAAAGAVLAFAAAYAALALMMRFLNAVSFTPYVIYRILLGAVLLAYAWS
jgi:undecaprenyl-diphosphatase